MGARISIFVLVLISWAVVPPSRAALTPEALDRAAKNLAAKILDASSGPLVNASSKTMFVGAFDDTNISPQDRGAGSVFRAFLIQRLLESGKIPLIASPEPPDGAGFVLTGTLSRSAETELIAAELVDGKTRLILWSKQEPIASVDPPSTRPGQARSVAGPEPPGAAEAKTAWLALAGGGYRGDGIFDFGVARRAASQRWEGSLEFGGFRHEDEYHDLSLDGIAKFSTLYFRAKIAHLKPIENLHLFPGEFSVRFPGFIKTGLGLGLYSIRESAFQHNIGPGGGSNSASRKLTTFQRILPMIELGLIRKLGPRLEIQALAEYAYDAQRPLGVRKYRVGGLGFLLQFGYRFL